MVNRNYHNGRAKEFRITKKFKAKGYEIAQRSAGSHSPVDVFAINREKKLITFIQAKPRSMSDKAKGRIEEELKWLNGQYDVEFVVM